MQTGVPVGDVEERPLRVVDAELEPEVDDHRRPARVVDVQVLEVPEIPPQGDMVDADPGEDPLEERVIPRLLQRGHELAKAGDEHRLAVVDLDRGRAKEEGEEGNEPRADQEAKDELKVGAHVLGSLR